MDRGIFPAILDEELAVPLLLGPMLFSHILGPSLDRKWLAEGTVNSFWRAHARIESQHAVSKSLPRLQRRG
jgi:hypothetical protein